MAIKLILWNKMRIWWKNKWKIQMYRQLKLKKMKARLQSLVQKAAKHSTKRKFKNRKGKSVNWVPARSNASKWRRIRNSKRRQNVIPRVTIISRRFWRFQMHPSRSKSRYSKRSLLTSLKSIWIGYVMIYSIKVSNTCDRYWTTTKTEALSILWRSINT